MATIFPIPDPNDIKDILITGERLACERCFSQVIVQESNTVPDGWELRRVTYPESYPMYAIEAVCPVCLAVEQARYARIWQDIELEQKYEQMKQAAIDWQYLVVLSGGIARKSDCEDWMMKRYGIDEYQARQITNQITDGPRYFTTSRDGVQWHEWTAHRPAPTLHQYPDISFITFEDLISNQGSVIQCAP